MKIKWIVRYGSFLFAVMLHTFYCSAGSIAGEKNALQWLYTDMLPVTSGISVLHYGASGFGMYPYGYSLPQAGLRVRLDGVPLRSISPFGPNLEYIPFQLVDHIKCNGLRELTFLTGDVKQDKPETVANFSIGERRRFNIDMTYKRKLGENSGILFNGSSSGVHVRDKSDENSFRNYFIKYNRAMENGSMAHFSMHALRDRDGIVNLDNHTHMGERKTDNVSVSLGLDNYPLGKRITLSPIVYYQSSNSRFHRYGNRKSMDDDAAGVNMILTTERGNTRYSLNASHDLNFFNSRIHHESWTRNETKVLLSFIQENDSRRIMLNGGLMNSSQYGNGLNCEGEFAFKLSPGQELIVRGLSTDEFPDMGKEYYTSLVFSDSASVSELEKFHIAAVECGIKFSKKRFDLGFFGFGSSSKLPLFRVSSAVMDFRSEPFSSRCYMSSRGKTTGYRVFFTTHGEKTYLYDMTMSLSHRIGSSKSKSNLHENWPYPSLEFFAGKRLSKKFFDERFETIFFGNSRFLRFNDGYSSPRGNFFFLDVGFVIKVSTLELFYTIENITNEEMKWFHMMGMMERNGMWGARWVFFN